MMRRISQAITRKTMRGRRQKAVSKTQRKIRHSNAGRLSDRALAIASFRIGDRNKPTRSVSIYNRKYVRTKGVHVR